MRTIDSEGLKQLLESEEDLVLVDTLPEEKYRKQHIPGARSAPVESGNFVKRVDGLVKGRDDTVVVYCASRDCDLSPKAARKLEDAGFTNVIDFEGGIEAWKSTGHEVASGAGARS